jgi:ABC transport system ATP-binding/permease protein
MSKVCLLFLISAIQTAAFVIIGNMIMGVHEMNFVYWVILFSTSCFANLLGLNISAALDSAVTIYILIPFLLIPQILLSGVIVRFEKLNPAITTQEGVPFIGNIMTSRWAYEALSVEQYANNPFEKKFFPLDAVMSRATYKKDWWIPAMRERLDKCEHLYRQQAPADSFVVPMTVLATGFNEEAKLHQAGFFPFLDEFSKKHFTHENGERTRMALDSLREFYIDQFNAASEKKESVINSMTSTPEKAARFTEEKNKFENESLEEMVKSSNQTDRLVVTNEKIIQRFEPIYHQNAAEKFFSAPLFSSVKNFAGKQWQTMNANMVIIWMMTLLLYFTLHLNLFRKVIERFSR